MTSTAHAVFRIQLLATTAGVTMALLAVPAAAQETAAPGAAPHDASAPADETKSSDSDNEGIGEIVVTAQRREQALQDVPISITALGGDVLSDQGVSNLNDYFREVPGLTVGTTNPARQRVSIRGIQSAGEATTGVYYDETPVTGPAGSDADAGKAQANLNLFDVERVEVLRGPQGTLYGAGSMGGTIRVIFNKPNTHTVEGAFEGEATTVKSGGQGFALRGMVNVPIARDLLAVRVTGFRENRPGYVDNVRLGHRNVNEGDLWGVRALVALTPTDNLRLDGTFIRQNKDYDDATTTWFKSLGDYKTDTFTKAPYESDFTLYNLTAHYDLSFAELVATASHYKWDSEYASDYTSTLSVNRSGSCPFYFGIDDCSPAQLDEYEVFKQSRLPGVWYQPSQMKSDSQEVRLGSTGDSPLTWTIGSFHERRYDHFDSLVYRADPATGDPLIIPGDETGWRYIETTVKQLAGFGEVGITIDKLTLTAGARYFNYTKTVGGEVLVADILTGSAVQPYQRVSVDADGWVTKLNASIAFTRDLMGYVTRSEGFRPGGANNVPGIPDTLLPYGADGLVNYEAGIKSQWFNRRLDMNLSVYQIDWSDMQINAQSKNGAWNFITNAGAARIRGFEIEGAARPIAGLSLTANLAYIDAKLSEDQVNSAIILKENSGRAGDRIVDIPKITASASAAYRWSLSDSVGAMLRADYTYTGSAPTQIRRTNVDYQLRPSYDLMNIRAGIETDAFDAYVFVRNAMNTKAITSIYTRASRDIYNRITTAPPRTIGVSLKTSF